MGLFNRYQKPGAGVKKNERQKKRLFVFFDIFKSKIWKLIKLNLLYLLFCIPVVTIGPATVAMMKINRYFVEEKPVFLFSDFKDAFIDNFKQGLIVGIINIIGFAAIIASIIFYYSQTFINGFYWILLIISILIAIVFTCMNFYIFLMIGSVELPILALYKNSFMMVAIGARSNIITFIITSIIMIPSILCFPLTLPILFFFGFSFCGFIAAFNSFQYIDEFMIKPYYKINNIKNPDEPEELDEEDIIFKDTI